MKGKFIKHPQLNVFQIPLVSIINMDHDLVLLAQRIDWKSVDKEFSIYYPYMGRQAVPVRKMVGTMILKQMYNLGDETFVDRWIENPYWSRYIGMVRPFSSMISLLIQASLYIFVNALEKLEHRKY